LLMDRDQWAIFIAAFHRCFLPSFGSFGQAVSEEKIFRNQPIRNKNSSETQMNWNLVGSIYGRSFTGDSCFRLADFLGSSPLKPFG
jgi:hypothetical protein